MKSMQKCNWMTLPLGLLCVWQCFLTFILNLTLGGVGLEQQAQRHRRAAARQREHRRELPRQPWQHTS